LRTPSDPGTRVVLPDGNAELTVEWAQCENERAPRTTTWSPKSRADRNSAAYECGTGAVYRSDKLVTRKHDLQSHAISFAAPPTPECWTTEAPSADAGAPREAGSATPDAGAAIDMPAVAEAGAPLTEEQAIARAEQAAKKAGRDLTAFQAPKAHGT